MGKFYHYFWIGLAALTPLSAKEKVALFNDTSASYHWGCTGTSVAVKEKIESLGFSIDSTSIGEVSALQDVPDFEDFDNPEKFKKFCKFNPKTIEKIQSSAAVVITGEGSIHDLRDRPRALLYIAHISKKFFNKHIEIINHSAYPKDDPALGSNTASQVERANAIYRSTYQKLDYIGIREPVSRYEMEKAGVSSTLTFDCLPLYIRDHHQKPKKVLEKTIVVAGSVAFSESGLDAYCRYMEKMKERGFTINVLVGAAAQPAADDAFFVDYLKAHCKAPFNVIVASSMEEWLDTIQQGTLLVSGRFHHSIAAFCLNTPFIALNSNTQKVHALCDTLEQPKPILFSDPTLLDQLLSRTEVILNSPPVNNDAKITEICNLAEKNFDGLRAISEFSLL